MRYQRLFTFVLVLLSGLVALPAQAREIKLSAELGTPVVEAGQRQKAYLKISLTGFELSGESGRTPANIAIVLDESGYTEMWQKETYPSITERHRARDQRDRGQDNDEDRGVDAGTARDERRLEEGLDDAEAADIAAQIEGGEAELRFADSASPTLILDRGDEAAQYVLMPLRV